MLRRLLPLLILFSCAQPMADTPIRTVTVTGSGQVNAAPDMATVQMSINARAKDLETAQSEAGRVSAAVLSMTDWLKIDRRHVDTTGATVRPDYRWNRDTEQQELRGYIAERQMTVNVKDLELLGKLVEGAVSAGVNQVSPPQLDSTRRKEHERESIVLAAKDARANAEVLAETLDAKLGDVLTITDGRVPSAPPVPMMQSRAVAMESDAAASYNAGDLAFTANVTVVFELTN